MSRFVPIVVNGVNVTVDKKQRSVLLHHPTKRDCSYTFINADHPMPNPEFCGVCEVVHPYKTFHLHLNEHGNVTIAEGIYEMFKDKGLLGEFQATKEVVPMPSVLLTQPMSAPLAATPMSGPIVEVIQQKAWQPPVVFSREQGMVKGPSIKET